jgi:hypothetical protein
VYIQHRTTQYQSTKPTAVTRTKEMARWQSTTYICRRHRTYRQLKFRHAFVLNKTTLVIKAAGSLQLASLNRPLRAASSELIRLWTVPRWSRDKKPKQFWTSRMFIYGDIHYLTILFCKKTCLKHRYPTLCCELYIFCNLVPLLSVYFYYTRCIGKHASKITHKNLCILIRSTFRVLKFMLPARRRNFVKVSRTVCNV